MCSQRFFERVQTRNPRWSPLVVVSFVCFWPSLPLVICGVPGLEWPPHPAPALTALLGTMAAFVVFVVMRNRVETFSTGQLKLEHRKCDEVELNLAPGCTWYSDLERLTALLNDRVADGSLKPDIQVEVNTPVFGCAKLRELGFRVRRLWCEERWVRAGLYSISWVGWRLEASLRGRKGPRYYGGPWWKGRQELGVLLDCWGRYLEDRADRRRAGNS